MLIVMAIKAICCSSATGDSNGYISVDCGCNGGGGVDGDINDFHCRW